MKLLRKIDSYFLYDEVDDEHAPLSDYFYFYGTLFFIVLMGAILTFKLIIFY